MYSLKYAKNDEIIKGNLSLQTIYMGKARVYHTLLPGKYKKTVDLMNMSLKLNFGIFILTSYFIWKQKNFTRTPDMFNKILFISSLWYFSFFFINYRMNVVYKDAYENLISRYSEEEIVKMINDISKTTKIIV